MSRGIALSQPVLSNIAVLRARSASALSARDLAIGCPPNQDQPGPHPFAAMKTMKQVGALPYVETESGLLVLLITTRGLGRWTIPKGWPSARLSDAELAAREAFEEAGVTGEVSALPIGNFRYTKRLHLFSWARCSVEVYALRASCQHLIWPEKAGRRSMWIEPGKAAARVKEPQLAGVLREFDGSATALLERKSISR
jgi:8-oxo-dGTP pyrophosphatase MutT (NUDIX family)